MTTIYKGAFAGCSWCGGQGCNQCYIEQKKMETAIEAQLKNPQPLFTAKLDNPGDMQLMKDYFGREALEQAFGPDGGGMQEIETNAAVASLIQTLREHD